MRFVQTEGISRSVLPHARRNRPKDCLLYRQYRLESAVTATSLGPKEFCDPAHLAGQHCRPIESNLAVFATSL